MDTESIVRWITKEWFLSRWFNHLPVSYSISRKFQIDFYYWMWSVSDAVTKSSVGFAHQVRDHLEFDVIRWDWLWGSG